MKNKRWRNVALGVAFILPVLGAYIGKRLLAKKTNKLEGIKPEVTRIRVPLVSLIGINDNQVESQPKRPSIVLPEAPEEISQTSDDDAGQMTSSSVASQVIASSERGKFHRLECRWAKNIKVENSILLDNRAVALEGGYIPCSTCNP